MKRNSLFALLALACVVSCTKSDVGEKHPWVGALGDLPARNFKGFTRQGSALTPQSRLRKLSMQLRGMTPELSEYQALQEAQKAKQLETFFAEKTKEYLGSKLHVGKMIDRLDGLFRMKTSSGLPETRLFLDPKITYPYMASGNETYNTMDLLFEDMAKNNLSWDNLLSAKSYAVASPQGNLTFLSLRDTTFYSSVKPELQQNYPPNSVIPIQFEADDPRIAGAVTTGRFFGRYSTTNLNKSRGRAAAMFRIFLCDEMRAVVEPKPGEEEELLKKAFPKPIHEPFDPEDDLHGSEPACMACHYKLDPMGKTFFTTGTILGEQAAPGALVYKRNDGTLVNVKGRGIGDIAAAILIQPEYARCQVSHFWKWFVRGDELPSEERLNQLVAEFNRLGHRTNDFIAYLVNEPEFFTPPAEENGITLIQTKEILERCVRCHATVPQKTFPDFTKFPIASEKEHPNWMRAISKALDLAHDGAKRSMPPISSAWQPSNEDIALLKSWVATGVMDEAGKITVDPKVTEEWLKP